MNGGAWWATVHAVTKSWTWLSDFTFTSHFHALEKEMATHSSVLAWRILEMGEPGGLPSMGSHRVGHDWSDVAAAVAAASYLSTLFHGFSFLFFGSCPAASGILVPQPGEGNGTPLQYSCLENPMNGGAWWATVHGVAQSRTWLKQLSTLIYTHRDCF